MAKTHIVKAARKFAGSCEKCYRRIERGAPYKWIGVKPPGDRPGEKRVRCEECEDWHEWEYNPSVRAQCARIAHDTENNLRYGKAVQTERDAQDVMNDAAHEILGYATQRFESARRAKAVAGPANAAVKKLVQDAEDLRRWAQRISRWRAPKLPEPDWQDCDLCSAKGVDIAEVGGLPDCMECGGTGRYVPDTPNDEQLEEWRHECADDAAELLNSCPL